MKQCVHCKVSRDLSEFNKNCRSKDGFQDRCRICNKEYRDSCRNKNVETPTELICTKCKIIKHIDCFTPNKTYPRQFDYWCLECRREYERRRKRIDWLHDLKRNIPCKDCGKVYEPYCMDFDHVSGEKKANVSYMVIHNLSKEKILEEIEKCEIVCILCHNKRTHERLVEKFKNSKPKYRPSLIRNIELYNKSKDKHCAICNQKYELYNMQFDHINPEEKFKDVCQLQRFAQKTLLKEINKCQVICALCHRRKSILEQRSKYDL